MQSPSAPPPPAPALPEPPACAHRPIQEEPEHHPLTSVPRPVPICLPASTNPRWPLKALPYSASPACFQTSGKGRKGRFIGGAQSISEVSPTASKRAWELMARLRPRLGNKSHCTVNPELGMAPTLAFQGHPVHEPVCPPNKSLHARWAPLPDILSGSKAYWCLTVDRAGSRQGEQPVETARSQALRTQ